TYTLMQEPVNGELQLNGAPLAVNGTFTQDDINNGSVSYTHDGGETASDSVTFDLSTPSASENGVTYGFVITPVNDAPTLTIVNASERFKQGSAKTFSTAGGNPIVAADVDAGTGVV